ncbi:MAG TPA: biotin transporter BioY [Segeticoccus sp.]|uniref:biotin transporter BioY n=1 Tax=Segeticoccus sp. TaxID=2706531 RepID=UPI002D7EB278|nr:biotin transporter BioY [Segeticoccus sp.]HET8598884.1 biotin transporter BioY [Segeticoccus sp.]
MSLPVSAARPVLADLVPGRLTRDLTLVVGTTALMAALAQVAVPLPFTPVPLSLATFVALLSGAALGPARASVSMGLYLVLGMVGLPIFAGHGSGWAFSSFGYILGYIAAAAAVGALARRGADRRVDATIAATLLGSLCVYACGVPWLMAFLHVGLGEALALGVVPFLIGDVVKSVAAALVLPAAWKLVGRR